MSKIVKKFINTPESCVQESLEGLVLADDKLKFCKHNFRVIYRSDIEGLSKKKKVTLISGGGSGHEPFAAGLVGKNALSAAISGDIFASPSSESVYDAIECVKSPAGTLVFVINYTGDRLNFGMAVERFRATNKDANIDLVYIDDDIALEDKSNLTVGGRGLAGAVIVFQIVGYLADAKGLGFEELLKESNEIVSNVATFGISLEACAIPGKPKMFELGDDEMEIGLGIHGEPGCERTTLKSAKESIAIVMEKLTKCRRLKLTRNDRFILLLNNLGSTSQLELNNLKGGILKWLAVNDYLHLEGLLIGTVMTSIDGRGFSISILKVTNDTWLEAFDHDSQILRHVQVTKPKIDMSKLIIEKPSNKRIVEKRGKKIDGTAAQKLQKALKVAAKALEAKESELNDLDGCGDGDCGTTLKTAATTILEAIENDAIDFTYPVTAFIEIAHIFEKSVGGTTGAIYAMFFTAGSTSLEESINDQTILEGMKRGLEAIMKYGHAKPGHRTMVDPLHSACHVVKSPKTQSDWKAIVDAAVKTAKDTAKMEAKSGRASYTASAQQTKPDPGAIAVATWMTAAFEAFFE